MAVFEIGPRLFVIARRQQDQPEIGPRAAIGRLDVEHLPEIPFGFFQRPEVFENRPEVGQSPRMVRFEFEQPEVGTRGLVGAAVHLQHQCLIVMKRARIRLQHEPALRRLQCLRVRPSPDLDHA